MREKSIEIPNFKTVEEASKVWFEHSDKLHGDSFVFYVQRESEEEKDELIGITTEDDIMKEEFTLMNTHEIIDAGDECKRAVKGKKVVLDPAMVSAVRPVVYGDCLFNVIPDRAILVTLK